jgi:VRR-NUC domain
MSESDLYAPILIAHSRGDCRLFRINAGLAYQGRVIERTPQRLVLSPWYPVKLAAEGVSDIIGWSNGGLFTAIEVKGPKTRVTPPQLAFIELVKRSGGRAGIARSVEDAGLIISEDPA